jgi:putative phosphoesterase
MTSENGGRTRPTVEHAMLAGNARVHSIGLISDTHGLLRPEILTALAGVDFILHAGDVGGNDILDELETLAPVQAVYGNTDDPGNPRLLGRIEREVDGLLIHVSHGHEVGSPNASRLLARYKADVIVYGHTHRQRVEREGGVIIVNPGAAGPRRFNLLPSVAILRIEGGRADVSLVQLPG